MVTSHFLHAYIVLQPEATDPDLYRVTVTARADVPYFGPAHPSPPLFRRGIQLREWILNKLINAETACYKAEKFSKLEQRTRASLLSNLVEDLTSKTQEFLESSDMRPAGGGSKQESPKTFLGSVKKVLALQRRLAGPEVLPVPPRPPRSPSSSLGPEDPARPASSPAPPDSGCGSSPGRGASPVQAPPGQDASDTSSLGSEEESLEPGEQAALVGRMQEDLARLKVDKLELLRQNVAAQREIKR
jgi:RAP1 GTPase activating protein 1